MQVNEWMVMNRAIEDGVAYGVRRAFKHLDLKEFAADPEKFWMVIQEEVEASVAGAVCEVFSFDQERDGCDCK